MTIFDTVESAQRSGAVAKAPVTFSSDWFHLTQAQVDAFAAATGDKQWIHQRDAKDAGSPFKGPIAHGLLLVCLAMNLARESGALDNATWVLYGLEKVRFRAPVPSMACVRCLSTIGASRNIGGRSLANVRLVVEIKNAPIPALVADCLLLNVGAPSIMSQNEG
jgi:acyl dehydratase